MINKLYLLQFVPLLSFVPLFSPVCCTSQLSATAADYLVREPPRTTAAVNRSKVLDGTGGHRRPALPGYCLLDNAMQQGMNEQTRTRAYEMDASHKRMQGEYLFPRKTWDLLMWTSSSFTHCVNLPQLCVNKYYCS